MSTNLLWRIAFAVFTTFALWCTPVHDFTWQQRWPVVVMMLLAYAMGRSFRWRS